VQTNIYDEVAWYIARHVVRLQSYRPTEINGLVQSIYTAKTKNRNWFRFLLNRLRP